MYFFKTMWKTKEMLELAYYFFCYTYCKVKIFFCESLAFLVSHFHLILRFLSFVTFILHRLWRYTFAHRILCVMIYTTLPNYCVTTSHVAMLLVPSGPPFLFVFYVYVFFPPAVSPFIFGSKTLLFSPFIQAAEWNYGCIDLHWHLFQSYLVIPSGHFSQTHSKCCPHFFF